VVPTLIHKFLIAQRDNTPVEIWGSGKPLREFIFSEDVAKLTKLLYDNYQGSDPVILSTSSEISIIDLVDLIKECFNFNREPDRAIFSYFYWDPKVVGSINSEYTKFKEQFLYGNIFKWLDFCINGCNTKWNKCLHGYWF
jgi:nucleoside-diphosphate-sugar epimerase